MTALEPDVTFTDYGLAVECAVLATWIARRKTPDRRLRGWLALFFGTIGLAAVTGGTVHGFFPDEQSLGFGVLWPLSLLAIGGTAVSAWAIGGYVVLPTRWARRVTAAAAVAFAGYAVVVLGVTQTFAVAIAHYAPSALFLLGAFTTRYFQGHQFAFGLGAVSVALMLLAAMAQRAGVTVHPVYFSHNALYHAVQGVAMGLFYLTARRLLDSPTTGD
ncbi:MAG: hypothetical protein AB1451_03195 [Nitrospirota bacterium]